MGSEPQPMSRMRHLWLRMTEIYGHKWTSAYGEDAESGAGETWAIGLAGLTARDVNTGLSAAIVSTDPWPPTLPMFRAMCLSLPSLAAVTLAIRTRSTPTAFIRLMWQYLDAYRLRAVDADKADRMVRDAYGLAREHVMQGRLLPPDPAAEIQHQKPEFKPAPPEVAERHLAEIAERLRVSEPEPEMVEDAQSSSGMVQP